jgi:probable F420-dependent oxidoreductase
MTQIKIGCTVQPQHATYSQMKETWLAVEQMGADSLWTWDHFFPLSGDSEGTHFEGYSLLAAMAEATSTIPFGMMVVCNSYRNPNLLADMARTIDHISGGRHILGIGSGWFERDYNEYGYDFKTAPARLRDLETSLPIIKERLSKLNPGPVNGHLPLLIGGSGPKVTLRLVAEHADMWNGGGTPDEAGAKNRILDEWCQKIGRNPDEIERTVMAGAPDILDLADAYVGQGFTHFILPGKGPDFDLSTVEKMISWRDSRNST